MLAVGREREWFYQGKGDNMPLQNSRASYTWSYSCCSSILATPHPQGRQRITAGCFHELNISQPKYLTALTYEITSSTSVLSHTSLAHCQVCKLKPLHFQWPLYQCAQSAGGAAFALPPTSQGAQKDIHTPLPAKMAVKASCHWCVDGQDKQTARSLQQGIYFCC